ncbi:MAG: hypothetical protein V3T86_17450 [Planctomycetota bacterium]
MTTVRRISLVLCLTAAVVADDQQREGSAKQAFQKIQAATRGRGGLKALLSREIRSVTAEAEQKLAAQLAQATVLKIKEKGDTAVVQFRATDAARTDVRELFLCYERDGWKLASTASFLTAGASLAKRNGKQPASARLEMRTTNGAYGASAYSFAHVTGDAQACKNRVDLWFCHNRDFHASRGAIVSLGKKARGRVKGIPVGAAWGSTAPMKKGHTYVLRCGPNKRRDFFVVFTVKSFKKDVVAIEWTLLSDGLNAPPSTQKPYLDNINPGDGADGSDGLCGKHG